MPTTKCTKRKLDSMRQYRQQMATDPAFLQRQRDSKRKSQQKQAANSTPAELEALRKKKRESMAILRAKRKKTLLEPAVPEVATVPDEAQTVVTKTSLKSVAATQRERTKLQNRLAAAVVETEKLRAENKELKKKARNASAPSILGFQVLSADDIQATNYVVDAIVSNKKLTAVRDTVSKICKSAPANIQARILKRLRCTPKVLRKVQRDRIERQQRATVIKFYERDDNTRASSSKKDTRCVNGSHYQKRFLLRSVGALFKKFQKEHPNCKVGRSSFFKWKPLHIVKPRLNDRDQCLCKQCTNLDV